jgi:hypothetical protein
MRDLLKSKETAATRGYYTGYRVRHLLRQESGVAAVATQKVGACAEVLAPIKDFDSAAL